MNRTTLLPLFALLLLAGCGDDPPSACFATADHAKYSDGQITSMCGCAVRQLGKWGITEKDDDLLAAVIRGKSASGEDRARAESLAKVWSAAMSACRKD